MVVVLDLPVLVTPFIQIQVFMRLLKNLVMLYLMGLQSGLVSNGLTSAFPGKNIDHWKL